EHEVFPLIGSRILIDRPQAPDESLKGYGFRYAGEGRLQRASSDPRWDAARATFAERGELPAQGELYVVQDGEVPGRGLRTPLEAGAWALLGLVCLALAARRLLRSLARDSAGRGG